jgi:hypothetical protein
MPKKTPKGKDKAAAATPKRKREAPVRGKFVVVTHVSTAGTRRVVHGMLENESAELRAAAEAAALEAAVNEVHVLAGVG